MALPAEWNVLVAWLPFLWRAQALRLEVATLLLDAVDDAPSRGLIFGPVGWRDLQGRRNGCEMNGGHRVGYGHGRYFPLLVG